MVAAGTAAGVAAGAGVGVGVSSAALALFSTMIVRRGHHCSFQYRRMVAHQSEHSRTTCNADR